MLVLHAGVIPRPWLHLQRSALSRVGRSARRYLPRAGDHPCVDRSVSFGRYQLSARFRDAFGNGNRSPTFCARV